MIDESKLNSVLINKAGEFNIRITELWNYKDYEWVLNAVFTNGDDLKWLDNYGMDSKVTSIIYTLLKNGSTHNEHIELIKEDNYINMIDKEEIINELRNHYYVKDAGGYKKVYQIRAKNSLINNTFDHFKSLYSDDIQKMKVESNQANGNYIIPLRYFCEVITHNMSFASFYTGRINHSEHIERLNTDENYRFYVLYCIVSILNGEPLDKKQLLRINYDLQTMDEKRMLLKHLLNALSEFYEEAKISNYHLPKYLKFNTDLLSEMISKVKEYECLLRDNHDFEKIQNQIEDLIKLKDFKGLEGLNMFEFWNFLLNLRMNYKSNGYHKLKS